MILCGWASVFSSFKSSSSCRSCCRDSLPGATETAVGFMEPLSCEDHTGYEDLTLQSDSASPLPQASTYPSVFLYSLGSVVFAALKTFLLVRLN